MKKTKNKTYRERIYAIADDITGQMASIVSGGIAGSGMKLRDLTGALKDLEDVFDVRSDDDEAERTARIEKLRRDLGRDAPEGVTVRFEGMEGSWAE